MRLAIAGHRHARAGAQRHHRVGRHQAGLDGFAAAAGLQNVVSVTGQNSGYLGIDLDLGAQ